MKAFYSKERYLDPFDAPCRVLVWRQNRTEEHFHDFTELVVVLSGGGEHHFNQRHYPIAAGDVFVIRPGMEHSYEGTHELVLANVMYDEKELALSLDELRGEAGYQALFEDEPGLRENSRFRGKLTLTPPELAVVRALIQSLARELEERKSCWRFAGLMKFGELVVEVSRAYGRGNAKPVQKMIKLGRMMRFVQDNFNRDISRDDIIRHGRVSLSAGTRLFNEFTGVSPIGFLLRTRLDHACALLRETDLAVSEVALRCGFIDSNYFSLCFRRRIGVPPSAFRAENR